MKTVIAKSKYTRGSARKFRIVVDQIKGMQALTALEVLKYVQRGAADKIAKVITSAVANAVHNDKLAPESLVIQSIFIDDAPMFKRGKAESKGRYRQILKRNSHITVVLNSPTAKDSKAVSVKQEAAKVEEAEVVDSESKKVNTTKPNTKKVTKK